jgi:hypothetical protein
LASDLKLLTEREALLSRGLDGHTRSLRRHLGSMVRRSRAVAGRSGTAAGQSRTQLGCSKKMAGHSPRHPIHSQRPCRRIGSQNRRRLAMSAMPEAAPRFARQWRCRSPAVATGTRAPRTSARRSCSRRRTCPPSRTRCPGLRTRIPRPRSTRDSFPVRTFPRRRTRRRS